MYKITINWTKHENNSLITKTNTEESIINPKGTRVVKDGEDWHGLQTADLD